MFSAYGDPRMPCAPSDATNCLASFNSTATPGTTSRPAERRLAVPPAFAMALTAHDAERLDEALALAAAAIGLSDPNPRVGCISADAGGWIVARGHTQHAGGPHAEPAALHEARARGVDLRGGTAWVTLEPCAHHGRTPPCCDALVAAGLARVVVGHVDPNPLVAGAGIARLRAAGIAVDLADAATTQRFEELNIGFLRRMREGRP